MTTGSSPGESDSRTAGSRPRTVGVIPARLASSRFPEKVLAAETGKPLVVHVLEQARKAKSLDAIVVAALGPRDASAGGTDHVGCHSDPD